jgi:hypothetical protein
MQLNFSTASNKEDNQMIIHIQSFILALWFPMFDGRF